MKKSNLAKTADAVTADASEADWEDFADRISAVLQKSVEHIIEAGRMLEEAKRRYKGTYLQILQKIGFGSPRKAQMYMEIARHPVLSNAKFVSHLPPSWGTLYELTKIRPHEKLEQMIADGLVRPDLERAEVEEIIKHERSEGRSLEECTKQLLSLWNFFEKYDDMEKVASELTSIGPFEDVLTSDNLRAISRYIDKLADIRAAEEAAKEKRDKERSEKDAEERRKEAEARAAEEAEEEQDDPPSPLPRPRRPVREEVEEDDDDDDDLPPRPPRPRLKVREPELVDEDE